MIPFLALIAFQTSDPYVRLGAALGDEYDRYEQYLAYAVQSAGNPETPPDRPVLPNGVPIDATPLAIRRAAAQRFSAVLDAFQQVSDTGYRPAEGALSNQDLAGIKALAKLVIAAARVKFADGDRHGAVTLLIDGLTMAHRIRSSSTTSLLVGCATQAIFLSEFSENLRAIPLPECDRVRSATDRIFALPTTAPRDLPPEIRDRWSAGLKAWATAHGEGPEVPIQHALAKDRLQLMLLRLHMRIEAYRWRQLVLPESLLKAAPAAEVDDATTGLQFRYLAEAGAYRLISDGLPEIGPLELKYRRTPDAGQEVPPINP